MIKFERLEFQQEVLTDVLAPFPKDFVIVCSYDDPKILELILRHPDFPQGTEVVTSEFSGISWNKICKKKSHVEQRKALMRSALGGAVSIFCKIAEWKRLSLWLGLPVVEREDDGRPARCYNSYVLLEDGILRFSHRKRYLFNKKNVFMEKDVFDVPPVYDGHFDGRTILICHEMQGFYDPVWKNCRLPEVRDGKSRLVIAPAIWTANKKDVLKRIARTIVRRRTSEPVDQCALNQFGSVALVADDNWMGVFGAVDKGRQKGACFVETNKAGWIHINRESHKIEIATV